MTLFTEPTIDDSIKREVPATYWNNNGLYQEFYETNRLVPSSGKAGTIEGEMIRSAGRLYYDYYNNGMCNNTSGAANFLIKCNSDFNLGINKELNTVRQESNTGGYTMEDLEVPLETIVNTILKYVISKDNFYTASELDMLDYTEEEPSEDDDPSEDDE